MTAGDIDDCVALLRAHDDTQDADEWVARFGRDVADSDKHPVVALVDGAVVGYARTLPFEPDPGSPADTAPGGYYLLGLVVAAAHRRHGLGSLLTDERVRWLRQRGSTAVYFFTAADNLASQRMHEQLGFRQLTSSLSFPSLPPDHGEILYELSLQ